MLIALLASALFWNLLRWWFALPNSSSHCLIGTLIGVAVGDSLAHSRDMNQGVHWHQLRTVLEGLALSPILGFLLAGALYLLTRKTLQEPGSLPTPENPRHSPAAGFDRERVASHPRSI
jgi:inorganic phosphate transporter, PiT family